MISTQPIKRERRTRQGQEKKIKNNPGGKSREKKVAAIQKYSLTAEESTGFCF